ncbi:hypothetical protein Taro_020648 [Colocasia esculenta]|uniref:Uncharacterized protein n=1 Tax=Colocasia esculenta TaxID=4460 RepID=A0A843V5U7_COLES|nr:hypothetical protein [Colocasia esculenta]
MLVQCCNYIHQNAKMSQLSSTQVATPRARSRFPRSPPKVAVGEVQDLAVSGPTAPPTRHVAARPHGPALRHAYLSKPWLLS